MDSFNNYIVDSKQLVINAVNIRRYLGKDTLFCAVVKANAYGLGIQTICKSIKSYVDYFAVACIKEAKDIRSFDRNTPILILGIVPASTYKWCSENNVTVTISNKTDIYNIENNINDVFRVHVALNTGLNRIGFKKTQEIKECLKLISNSKKIVLDGMFSHFATKHNDTLFIKKQFYSYMLLSKVVKDKVIKHISNSFATIYNGMYHLDMVRCGYLLYGNTATKDINNKPVLKITSKVVSITYVNKGESIGYDRNYLATKNMMVGIVPIGYADGLDRRLSNKGYFYINNKKCPIIGNICMDVTMVDITECEAVVGDNVLILGCDGVNKITLEDYSKILGTSPYEIQLKFKYDRMNYLVV